jgi:hypothetical protein
MNKIILRSFVCVLSAVATKFLFDGMMVMGHVIVSAVMKPFSPEYSYIHKIGKAYVEPEGNWSYSLTVYKGQRAGGFTTNLQCIAPPGQALKVNDRIFIYKNPERYISSTTWCSLNQNDIEDIKARENK